MKKVLLFCFIVLGVSAQAHSFACSTITENRPAFLKGNNMVVELAQRCKLPLKSQNEFNAKDIANIFIHLIRQSDQLLLVSEKDVTDDTFEINYRAVRTGSGGVRTGSISTNEKLTSAPSRVSYESISFAISAQGLAALAKGVRIEANVFRQCASPTECILVLETTVVGEIEKPKISPFQLFKATVLPILLNEFNTTSSVFQQYIEITVRSKIVSLN